MGPRVSDRPAPRVSVFPVALMDHDENKVDECVTLCDELAHVVQCDCDCVQEHKGKRRAGGIDGDSDDDTDDEEGGGEDEHDEEDLQPLATEQAECGRCRAAKLLF